MKEHMKYVINHVKEIDREANKILKDKRETNKIKGWDLLRMGWERKCQLLGELNLSLKNIYHIFTQI